MICPDCKQPITTHEMFDPPACPVVRVPWPEPGWPFSDEFNAWLRGEDQDDE